MANLNENMMPFAKPDEFAYAALNAFGYLLPKFDDCRMPLACSARES
jgi:hypothetical protein